MAKIGDAEIWRLSRQKGRRPLKQDNRFYNDRTHLRSHAVLQPDLPKDQR